MILIKISTSFYAYDKQHITTNRPYLIHYDQVWAILNIVFKHL